MTKVRLAAIRKSYGDMQVLHGVDIDIEDGEFMVFVGPSGCGKSTLLRSIAGLEPVTSGRIIIGEQDVTNVEPADRGVAMVFQSYALYPHMTVEKNMAFGLRMAGMPRAEIRRRIDTAASILQIEDLLHRKPRQLSGGQRQRAAIGRSIVRDPKVFLFDEPLSNLDAALRVQMRLELVRLHHRLKATMIYVTHDQIEAMTMADRIVVLNDGHVEQIGTPLDLYRRPANRFVAGFIGSPRMNFLEVTVTAVGADGIRVELPDRHGALTVPVQGEGISVADTIVLGVRPEHIPVATPGTGPDNGTPVAAGQGEFTRVVARVLVVEHLGGEIVLNVIIQETYELMVKIVADVDFVEGQELSLDLVGSRCHLFGHNGAALPRM
ncbi:sn-glycerol-3-phosphate ABC transporter ATP-binding protein UgpC [Fodinicurvata sp. EGI_FJ10296]|uniref:ABC transporter ATP-binding protein n=1 Tax=Fodinicurvata sp. EGI_FJ10296 TaxID=3231908 RepID=UPI003451DFC7